MTSLSLDWQQFDRRIAAFANKLRDRSNSKQSIAVFGVPTGGCFLSEALASKCSNFTRANCEQEADFVIDDICDSGSTLRPFLEAGFSTDAMFARPSVAAELAPSAEVGDHWIQFPWEHSAAPTDAVTRILQFIGEDPKRNGLRDTPDRVMRAWKELTVGYTQDPAEILSTVFEDTSDEMIVLRGITLYSMCEHHLLPFMGEATVAYIPNGKVVGLSKLARLVECFSRRLQIQERLTNHIAAAVQEHLQPLGVGVIIKAHHLCMGCRGVRQTQTEMITSALLGKFRDTGVRGEFLHLATPR